MQAAYVCGLFLLVRRNIQLGTGMETKISLLLLHHYTCPGVGMDGFVTGVWRAANERLSMGLARIS